MNNFSKIIIFLVICAAGFWCYDTFLSQKFTLPDFSTQKETEIPQKEEDVSEPEKEQEKAEEEEKTTQQVYIYMLTTDKTGNQFLKPIARSLPSGQDKLSYSIKQLFIGPNKSEEAKGIYSEVPDNAKLLGITTTDKKIIIDISESFGYGGGSDSIYSRMRQLIKTAIVNSDKPVYLYINGKQADVIGGEGISITQPLSEKSLDE